MNRLEGKIAIATGSSSGIGETLAKLCADEGATVVLVARREGRLTWVKADIEAKGGRASYFVADLSMRAGCEATIDFAVAQHGRIDGLVNNAGIPDKHMPTTRTSDELSRLGTKSAVLQRSPSGWKKETVCQDGNNPHVEEAYGRAIETRYTSLPVLW